MKSKHPIVVTYFDLAAALELALEHTPSQEEIQQFIDYVSIDVGTWLNENAKSFVRKLAEEGRLSD